MTLARRPIAVTSQQLPINYQKKLILKEQGTLSVPQSLLFQRSLNLKMHMLGYIHWFNKDLYLLDPPNPPMRYTNPSSTTVE
jgi:hypothetical protein